MLDQYTKGPRYLTSQATKNVKKGKKKKSWKEFRKTKWHTKSEQLGVKAYRGGKK